ncbi:hypothetical protein BAY61_27325 [Prauserella marina]|uniref:Drug resistance transporter, EmrB/QacA subfamily n=1 Tax=Prauserella marina TaxID=530584 RepID=A0A222VVX3_9PSEU|nr:MFS transporter [Prauserella marina]ASR38106.1 hypothetical protein BAY61_27325 [Prauserella marina]PWV78736.1 EmrB/QacA subfamily drug resistance transporter [Prauserella marina]SDC92498.1 drug resistance transporter, EmrB/QacA subfamily [Prauserella marina]
MSEQVQARTPSDTAGGRRWWGLVFVLTGNVTVFGAVTIMNTAVPAVQAELGMADATRGWVLTVFSLCFGALMLISGRIADALGLRRCMLAGLVGFAAASLLGGLATTSAVLLVARGVQGAAGALVAATALALLSVMFPAGTQRRKAFAILGAVMGMGTAGSFLLAGTLIETVSWRWCLLINIPLALVAAIGLRATAPPGQAPARGRIDILGAGLLTAAVAALVTGLNYASQVGWTHPLTPSLLGAALGLGTLFVLSARRSSDPLVPTPLITDRRRMIAFTAVFILGAGMFAGMWVLTTFLQGPLGYSAFSVGLAFIPFGLSATLTSFLLVRLTRADAEPARLLAAGLSLAAVALGTFLLLTPQSTYLTGVLPAMVLLGAGGTIVMVTGSNIATRDVGSLSGTASSLINATQQLGAAIGTAVLTSIALLTARGRSTDGSETAEADLAGHTAASATGAIVLAATAAALLLVGRRARGGASFGSAPVCSHQRRLAGSGEPIDRQHQ